MTVGVTLPQGPNHPVGPGAPLDVSTTSTVLPGDLNQWAISINLGTSLGQYYWVELFPLKSSREIIHLGTGTKQQPNSPLQYPVTDTGIQVILQRLTNGVVAEQATAQNAVWDGSNYLGELLQAGQTTQGGFTAEDRLQLQTIETRSQVLGEPQDLVVQTPSGLQTTTIGQLLSRPLLDTLTLHEATSGPTSAPVRFAIKEYYFGVIVRVTTIAPDLTAKTPDLEWFFPDLAVLRVFRGVDLQFRRGIHTPTFMTEHPWEWGLPILNQTDILGIPPDITIAVDWRAGCAGQVFLQKFP